MRICKKCGGGSDAETAGWICEKHPHLAWPHDNCPGPGMPCDEPGCPDSLAGLRPGPEAFKRIADRLLRQQAQVCATAPGILAAIDQAEAAHREER